MKVAVIQKILWHQQPRYQPSANFIGLRLPSATGVATDVDGGVVVINDGKLGFLSLDLSYSEFRLDQSCKVRFSILIYSPQS